MIHRYMLWVPYYMHMLVGFFDYFLCDGSHGFSKYGWKFIPICIISSGGKTVPIGAVFGLEEDRQSLDELFALFRQHCEQHGVDCPQFQLRNYEGNSNFFQCTLSHLGQMQYQSV